MATLLVKFIKTTHREGALYSDKSVVKEVSFTGRRIVTEEKKNGYELAYYCRKTKSQCECWLCKYNDCWHIFYGKSDDIPSAWSYDTIFVDI